jgi:exopolyphosphatase/guanosine-5'-triphosphate,3'-diphosphate pyrophosphatase
VPAVTARRRARVRESEVLAAVDLGSNSFHMVVARHRHGQLVVIDRLREMVRLASGLGATGRLSAASQARALACLRRFGERLRAMRAARVRVVGTNTLRRARGAGRFVQQAGRALGHPVEVISGIEEARLIYLGAAHHLPRADGPRLVVDIGGGSTEIILGRALQPRVMESLSMGCVSVSEGCFPRGRLSARNFQKARLQARLELEPVRSQFGRAGTVQVAGTSGSIRSAQAVLAALGRCTDGITVDGLEYLIGELVAAGSIDDLRLPELSRERAEVFPGGVAILVEVMQALGLDSLTVADGALREGMLYDLMGRLTDEDARARTVRAMAARYHVDQAQADRVERTALLLLEQVDRGWDLGSEPVRQALAWAARLHELGLDIAHAHYHHHGAYVIENADMPGFTREEQGVVARLVQAHRRRFDRAVFRSLPPDWQRPALRLSILLRLAVLFHRSRTAVSLPKIQLHADGRSLRLRLPAAWLKSSPLTLADLEREAELLGESGIRLALTRAR